MRYREIAPAPELRPWIRCYWLLAGTADRIGPAEPALPDGCAELVFNLGGPIEAGPAGGAVARQPSIVLVGQITGPMAIGPTGRVDIVAVRFEPWGATLLRPDQRELTDRWIGDTDLELGILRETRDRLADCPTDEARAAVLDQALAPLARQRTPDRAVLHAAREIRRSHGAISLDTLTRDLGTSSRQLQRRFAAEVGMSPKLLARVTRFQRVFSAWREEPGSWARVAARCGYYDQSHLVRDFRDFAGSAPAAFLADPGTLTPLFTALRDRRAS